MKIRFIAAVAALALATTGAAALIGPAKAVAPISVTSKAGRLPLIHTATQEGDAAGNVKAYIDGKMVPTGAASSLASFPFNGFKFGGTYVCQDDNIGGGVYYPTVQAGNFLEAGQSPIVLANDNGETTKDCVNYTDEQTMHYSLYNTSGTNACWKTTGAWTIQNGWNIWFHMDAMINVNPLFCGNTAQHRANTVSRVTGAALGLVNYGPTGNGDNCIMNSWYIDVYSYAGTCETGRLGWLY